MAIDIADMQQEAPDLEQEERPKAPTFPDPEPIDFSEEEQKNLIAEVKRIYSQGVFARNERTQDHLVFDQMFMGQVDEFNPRVGPWKGSAHLHVQMPYWLVDALQARVTYSIWSQNPQVAALPQEDDDDKIGINAARAVQWNFGSKRMNAEEMWSRLSKIRLIHGNSVGVVTYVHDKHTIRTIEYPEDGKPVYMKNLDGSLQFDEVTGQPIEGPPEGEVTTEEKTFYRGPTITPLDWDDTILRPVDSINLQPRRLKNPLGAEEVVIRQWERLRSIVKKTEAYPHAIEGERDRDWWVGHAGDQARVGSSGSTAGGNNNQRARQQDETLGINRTQANANPTGNKNPEFEILQYYGPWIHPDTGEEEEMVISISVSPEVFLGAFRLTDLVWTGKRPLIEMGFQSVANQWYSMGVCELVYNLSDELDSIHNLRMDVGMATNLPFYFAKASSSIKPSEITLSPLKIIPVDDPRDIVPGSHQNVTSFFHQEEQGLLQIIERVMGIADLFLGLSPTTGASSRHATGWMGQKQEAEARLASVLAQDARSFSFLCGLVHDLETQFGPRERSFRLLGEDNSAKLTRDDLWFRGVYDFQLGANVGMFSQQNRFERAQTAFQFGSQSPLVQQDLGRRWELEHELYQSMGYRESEIVKFIGKKEAVSAGTSKSQDEENAAMMQYALGDAPSPINPNDNDQEHIDIINDWLSSEEFNSLGRPNEVAIRRHSAQHQNAIAQKMQQQQQATAQAMQPQDQPPGVPGNQGGADPQQRAQAQIPQNGFNSAGSFSAPSQNGTPGPPNLSAGQQQ